MNYLLKILIAAFSVFVLAHVLPGIQVSGYMSAIIVAIALGLLNNFIKPILVFLTFPITIVTLGLFLLVINAGMVLLADYFISGFSVSNWFWALVFSFCLSFLQSILNKLLKKKEN